MNFSFDLEEFLEVYASIIADAESAIEEYQCVERVKSEEILANFFASDEGKEVERILSEYNEKILVDRLNVWDVEYASTPSDKASDVINQCMKIISNSDFVSTVRPRFEDTDKIEINTIHQVRSEPNALRTMLKNASRLHKMSVNVSNCGLSSMIQMTDEEFDLINRCRVETYRLRGVIGDIKNS